MSDGALSDTDTVIVTVTDPNDPPTANDDNMALPNGRAITIDVLSNDTDPNVGDVLSLTSVGAPANGIVTLNADDTVTYKRDRAFKDGCDSFTYTIADSQGAPSGATVFVAVGSGSCGGNLAPAANAGPDQTVTDTDGDGFESVTLDGSISSDDGTIVSYDWTNGSMTPDPASGVTPPVTLPVGTHTITLTVMDDGGLPDTDQVEITVNAPGASATAHVGDLDESSASVGKKKWRATVEVEAHDATSHATVSNATVSGSFSDGGAGSCVTSASGRCQITSGNVNNGIASVTFSVTGITGSNISYDQPANHDIEADSDGSTIVVNSPS